MRNEKVQTKRYWKWSSLDTIIFITQKFEIVNIQLKLHDHKSPMIKKYKLHNNIEFHYFLYLMLEFQGCYLDMITAIGGGGYLNTSNKVHLLEGCKLALHSSVITNSSPVNDGTSCVSDNDSELLSPKELSSSDKVRN